MLGFSADKQIKLNLKTSIMIIEKILDIAFSGTWQFFGMMFLLNGAAYFIINGIVRIWVRFTRVLMVRKHGWPPSHLDADGDWATVDEEH